MYTAIDPVYSIACALRIKIKNIRIIRIIRINFLREKIRKRIMEKTSEVKRTLYETFQLNSFFSIYRSSRPEVFLGKDVLKICSKFTEEHHAKVRF